MCKITYILALTFQRHGRIFRDVELIYTHDAGENSTFVPAQDPTGAWTVTDHRSRRFGVVAGTGYPNIGTATVNLSWEYEIIVQRQLNTWQVATATPRVYSNQLYSHSDHCSESV